MADGGRRLAHVVHLGAVGRVGYVVILATLVLVATLALLLIVEIVVLLPSRVSVTRLATVGCGAYVGRFSSAASASSITSGAS